MTLYNTNKIRVFNLLNFLGVVYLRDEIVYLCPLKTP